MYNIIVQYIMEMVFNIVCDDCGWNYIEVISESYKFGNCFRHISINMDIKAIKKQFRYYKEIKRFARKIILDIELMICFG